jgi:hypothetical protein
MGVDISRAFKAPFEDPDWVKKTLLGWLWFLLFFTIPAVYGAMIEYVQRVSRGDNRLPEWDDFGGKWVKGLLVFVAGFIYFLPVVVLGAILVVPLALSAQTNAEGLTGLLAGGMCLFWVVAAAYSIAVSILFYAAIVNYAMKGHFGAFFEVSEILAKVKVPGYWMAWLFTIVVSIAASAITSVLTATYIGGILVGAVVYLESMMIAHLFGQWATDAYGIAPAYAAPAGYAPMPTAPPMPPAPAQPAMPAPAAPVAAPPVVPAAAAPPAAPYVPPVTPPAPPVVPPAPDVPAAAPVPAEPAPAAPPAAAPAPAAPPAPPAAPPAPPAMPAAPPAAEPSVAPEPPAPPAPSPNEIDTPADDSPTS